MTIFTTVVCRGVTTVGLLAALFNLVGCDTERIQKLEEGISTEADVRAQFGQPENVWDGPDGVRVLEYNRQPNGAANYMIGIGPGGKMVSLRQVVTPANFARVQPGMAMEEVRKLLGKPAKVQRYDLQRETHYDWHYTDPQMGQAKVFTAVFDEDLRVLRTMSVERIYEQGR